MTSFKKGDIVIGNEGYSFDPIEGKIMEIVSSSYILVKIRKCRAPRETNEVWNYSVENLKLKTPKNIDWEEELK